MAVAFIISVQSTQIDSNFGGGNGGAGGSGGGILNSNSTGNSPVKLFNSLIALNSFGSGGNEGSGSDINDFEPPGPPGNPGSDGISPDLLGGFSSQGYNLVGEANGSSGL